MSFVHPVRGLASPAQAVSNAPDTPENADVAESVAHGAARADAPIRYAARLGQLMHAPLYHSSSALTVVRLPLRGCFCEAVVAL